MKTLPYGTIKRIHVDRRVLAQNRKSGADRPAWTIQTSKGPIKCRLWRLGGSGGGIAYGEQGKKPLSCGARMYIETYAEIQYS